MVDVTGGGFYDTVPRVLHKTDHAALIDMDSWHWPDVFSWLQQAGNIAEREMLTTFNCGIGFLLILPAEQATAAMDQLTSLGENPITIGKIVPVDTVASDSQMLIR